jgi:hypothetical protein
MIFKYKAQVYKLHTGKDSFVDYLMKNFNCGDDYIIEGPAHTSWEAIGVYRYLLMSFYIYFKNEEDLLAFKLKFNIKVSE